MMKKENQFKRWICDQARYYLPILGLELEKITTEKNTGTDYMCITCAYPYTDHKIKYSEEAFRDWSDGKLEKDRILHELCHIITDPLYCKAISRYVSKDEITDEREKLTDTMAAIIRKLDERS